MCGGLSMFWAQNWAEMKHFYVGLAKWATTNGRKNETIFFN